jgi:hypothetical protein
MCGLIGMYTPRKSGLFMSDAQELFHLTLLNSVRGSDSTGMAGINLRVAESQADIVKVVGNPYNLRNFEDWGTFSKRITSDYTGIIAHGRYATQGAVNAVNAHPFKEGRIVGAHNGVIRNFKDLNKGYEQIEVDSQLIFRLFNDVGVEETIKEINGAFVFMWFDTLQGTMNVVRNSERPLFVGKYSSSDTLVFASEKETLVWNATRNKTPLVDIEEIPVGKLHTWDGLNLKPEVREVELKKYIYLPVVTTPTRTTPTPSTIGGMVADTGKSVKVGDEVTFEINDYLSKQKNGMPYYEVTGDHPTLTSIKLVAHLYNSSEKDIYDSDFCRGKVLSMEYQLVHGIDTYVCRLGGATLGKALAPASNLDDDEDPMQRVELIDAATSEKHSLSLFRLKQLAADGCVWCFGHIDYRSVLGNSRMYSYWDGGHTSGTGVVCPTCNHYDNGSC